MPEHDPPLDWPDYKSTALRHPKQPLVYLPQEVTETTGPQLGLLRPPATHDNDLTRQHDGEPLGERITVSGRLLDADGRPIRDSLVEIWQCNAAGRYRIGGTPGRPRWTRTSPAAGARSPTPTGATSSSRSSRARTRGATTPTRGGPAHIHFSLLGRSFEQRLVTQMYFPDDPLFPYDPIFNSVRDPEVRARMISRFSIDASQENWALAYEFDIVLGGRDGTPIDEAH